MKNSLVYLFIALLLLSAALCQDDESNQLVQVGTLTSDAALFYASPIPNPISIRVSQNGTVFIAYQQGVIQAVTPGVGTAATVLDISSLVTPADPAILDRGLIGFDLHRDFENNRLFYLFYTAPAAAPGADLCPAGVLNAGVTCDQINSQFNHIGKLVEYKWDGVGAVESRVMFVMKHPFNGGHSWNTLKYNRYQDRLYLALGDAGCTNDPFGLVQNRNYFAGKVISFDMSELTWACAEPVATFSDLSSICNASVGRIILEGFGLRNPSGLMFSTFGDNGEFGLDYVGNDAANSGEFSNDEWNYLIFDNTPQYGEINYAIGDELPNFGWPHLDSNICNIGFNRTNLCPELESLVPTRLLGLFKIPIAAVPVNPGFTYPTISSGVIVGRSFLRTLFNESTENDDNLDNLILFSAPANGTGVNGTSAGSALYAVRLRSDFEQQYVNNLDRCSEEDNGSQGWGLGRLVEDMDVRQLIPIPITAGVDPGAIITSMYNDGRQIYFGLSTGTINVLRLARAAPVVPPTRKK